MEWEYTFKKKDLDTVEYADEFMQELRKSADEAELYLDEITNRLESRIQKTLDDLKPFSLYSKKLPDRKIPISFFKGMKAQWKNKISGLMNEIPSGLYFLNILRVEQTISGIRIQCHGVWYNKDDATHSKKLLNFLEYLLILPCMMNKDYPMLKWFYYMFAGAIMHSKFSTHGRAAKQFEQRHASDGAFSIEFNTADPLVRYSTQYNPNKYPVPPFIVWELSMVNGGYSQFPLSRVPGTPTKEIHPYWMRNGWYNFNNIKEVYGNVSPADFDAACDRGPYARLVECSHSWTVDREWEAREFQCTRVGMAQASQQRGSVTYIKEVEYNECRARSMVVEGWNKMDILSARVALNRYMEMASSKIRTVLTDSKMFDTLKKEHRIIGAVEVGPHEDRRLAVQFIHKDYAPNLKNPLGSDGKNYAENIEAVRSIKTLKKLEIPRTLPFLGTGKPVGTLYDRHEYKIAAASRIVCVSALLQNENCTVRGYERSDIRGCEPIDERFKWAARNAFSETEIRLLEKLTEENECMSRLHNSGKGVLLLQINNGDVTNFSEHAIKMIDVPISTVYNGTEFHLSCNEYGQAAVGSSYDVKQIIDGTVEVIKNFYTDQRNLFMYKSGSNCFRTRYLNTYTLRKSCVPSLLLKDFEFIIKNVLDFYDKKKENDLILKDNGKQNAFIYNMCNFIGTIRGSLRDPRNEELAFMNFQSVIIAIIEKKYGVKHDTYYIVHRINIEEALKGLHTLNTEYWVDGSAANVISAFRKLINMSQFRKKKYSTIVELMASCKGQQIHTLGLYRLHSPCAPARADVLMECAARALVRAEKLRSVLSRAAEVKGALLASELLPGISPEVSRARALRIARLDLSSARAGREELRARSLAEELRARAKKVLALPGGLRASGL